MMGIRIIATTLCQLSCIFCHFEGARGKHQENIIDINNAIKILDNIISVNNFDVTLSGGEPLLHPNLLDLILFLKSINASITLVTNGQDIVNNVALFEHIDSVHVSLPTLDSREYSEITGGILINTLNGINSIVKLFPNKELKINYVERGDNITNKENLIELIEYATEIGGNLKIIREFDPTTKQTIASLDIIEKLMSYGYKKCKNDGRVAELQHCKMCQIEVTETSCGAAQKYLEPCKHCTKWADTYLGVNCETYLCPWK